MTVCKTVYIGSNPILDSVIDVRMVGPKIVALRLAGSNPVYHPILRGGRFPDRSHKPVHPSSILGPATKKIKNIL